MLFITDKMNNWDSIDYEKLNGRSAELLPILSNIADLIKEQDVLDVAAGGGVFAAELSKYAKTVIAIDQSESAIKVMRKILADYKNIKIVKSVVESISLPNKSVDVVFIANALHDIGLQSITKLNSLIRDGGYFIDLDWDKEAEGVIYGPPISIRLSASSVTSTVEEKGLKLIDKYYYKSHYLLIYKKE